MRFMDRVQEELKAIAELLAAKNEAYGNSALAPLRIFSRSTSVDGILVRIDDKLSRIRERGTETIEEDTLLDLIGYLILLRLAMKES